MSARGLRATIGERILFDQLDFDIGPGEIFAATGPSGVGKSTLLAGLAGQFEFDSGEVEISADRVEWLVQSAPLLTRRTALANAAMAAEIRFGVKPGYVDRASEVLSRLGLGSVERRVVYRLSGGERQRVALARAVVAEPEVLLADEPTASLDADSRQLVLRELRELSGQGCAVLVATHDPVVMRAADRTLDLERFRDRSKGE